MATASTDLEEAQRFYVECLDAMSDQRKQIEEDLRFSDPSNPMQWDETVKSQRENDPGGKRPCLVHDQLGQYTAQVTGQIEKQPPSIHAIPVSGGAEKQAAEQIDGRFRHIEHASRASQHYARALTCAARAGVGYLIIRPEYVDRALNWQEPRIGSEGDPLKVVFDPWSVETDGQDATVAWLLSDLSDRAWDMRWKGKDKRSFGDLETSTKDDTRKSTLVAEQWLKEERTTNMVVYVDQSGQEQSLPEDEFHSKGLNGAVQYVRNYANKQAYITWKLMSGCDVLAESEYPADSIGIVPVYGYIGFADGRMRYCGIPRRARAPQQAYNYHISEQLAYIGTAPKNPWVLSKRAATGVEALWDNASRESRGWLPYNDVDELGVINQPQRVNPSVNLVNHEQGAAQALKDIQGAIGMYQANLGAPSNETSGVAIESRKEQGESSTAHFPSHMAASLGQVGNIVMQMDARLADTRRKQPILGVDGMAGSIMVDPKQEGAFQRTDDGISINPSIGKYGVRVVVGASYSTQRTQTNAAFAEIMRGNKELAPTVAPFWAQTLDFPGSDKFAQAMAAMAPPPVKAILQPADGNKEPDPALMAQQLAETQAALQEAIQHAKEAQDDADTAIAKLADRDEENRIKDYDAHTKRLQVTAGTEEQITAVATQVINDMLSQEAELPGDPKPEEPAAAAPAPAPAPAPVEPPAPDPRIDELMAGHKAHGELMQKLIQLVQADRERIPVKDKDGKITRVIDRISNTLQ